LMECVILWLVVIKFSFIQDEIMIHVFIYLLLFIIIIIIIILIKIIHEMCNTKYIKISLVAINILIRFSGHKGGKEIIQRWQSNNNLSCL
jgi:hypothetical protein